MRVERAQFYIRVVRNLVIIFQNHAFIRQNQKESQNLEMCL